MNDALPTLLFPFERSLLETPRAGERVIFFGASAGLQLPPDFAADIQVVQGFRPDYLGLERAGFSVAPQAEGEGYDAALLLLGRHRRENEQRLAEALRRVRPHGLILAAGTKRDGAPGFTKRLSELVPLEDRLSKHHGIVFWLRRPARPDEAIFSGPARVTPEGYETAVGGFSDDGADPGSQLLADNLPSDISGSVADFAAGWGYLSLWLAKQPSIAAIDLYEAHHASLEAAKRNLATHAPETACDFFWHDLMSEPVARRYEAIVMNPPFHRSRAAEPDIGRALIGVAANTLAPGGRLFLVANRPLPYETAIASSFKHHGEICRDATYKVLWGRK
ncbi:class I SAM-dependent methyltransferase [Chelativorans salis]|uniref:Class I SAM-dependent methyltransferase n=1 Tax=Chelativorans salis TaxID=2978478 RepID=A0ABT2LIY2_9HYPH|nr:class I SAM-dependent methyltransferase [Chelativorans sp. EGI FJ00035]MCT7374541.1 class I SAM-dependent methyltransferase [Chelativorans sp. EGI FJ00035]